MSFHYLLFRLFNLTGHSAGDLKSNLHEKERLFHFASVVVKAIVELHNLLKKTPASCRSHHDRVDCQDFEQHLHCQGFLSLD